MLWWLSRRGERLHGCLTFGSVAALRLYVAVGSSIWTSRWLDCSLRARYQPGRYADPALRADRWITAACELVKSKCRSLVKRAALRRSGRARLFETKPSVEKALLYGGKYGTHTIFYRLILLNLKSALFARVNRRPKLATVLGRLPQPPPSAAQVLAAPRNWKSE